MQACTCGVHAHVGHVLLSLHAHVGCMLLSLHAAPPLIGPTMWGDGAVVEGALHSTAVVRYPHSRLLARQTALGHAWLPEPAQLPACHHSPNRMQTWHLTCMAGATYCGCTACKVTLGDLHHIFICISQIYNIYNVSHIISDGLLETLILLHCKL